MQSQEKIIFNEYLPRLTKKGYELVKCPSDTWSLIRECYFLLQKTETEERFPNKDQFIKGGKSTLMSFDRLPSIQRIIHQQLLPLHYKFCLHDI